jgi:hypothetical protein
MIMPMEALLTLASVMALAAVAVSAIACLVGILLGRLLCQPVSAGQADAGQSASLAT